MRGRGGGRLLRLRSGRAVAVGGARLRRHRRVAHQLRDAAVVCWVAAARPYKESALRSVLGVHPPHVRALPTGASASSASPQSCAATERHHRSCFCYYYRPPHSWPLAAAVVVVDRAAAHAQAPPTTGVEARLHCKDKNNNTDADTPPTTLRWKATAPPSRGQTAQPRSAPARDHWIIIHLFLRRLSGVATAAFLLLRHSPPPQR